MTIQDLGSIGELVAAIATVATLIYLALQIRANTRALKIDARRSESEIVGGFYANAIIGSSDVARIFNAGLADPTSLAPEEATRFLFLMGRLLGAESSFFDEVRSDLVSTEELERRKRNLIRFIATHSCTSRLASVILMFHCSAHSSHRFRCGKKPMWLSM